MERGALFLISCNGGWVWEEESGRTVTTESE